MAVRAKRSSRAPSKERAMEKARHGVALLRAAQTPEDFRVAANMLAQAYHQARRLWKAEDGSSD